MNRAQRDNSPVGPCAHDCIGRFSLSQGLTRPPDSRLAASFMMITLEVMKITVIATVTIAIAILAVIITTTTILVVVHVQSLDSGSD